MPNPAEFGDDLLQAGVRAERLGELDRALESYTQAAERSSDPATVAQALTHQADVHRVRAEWDVGLVAARKAQGVARQAGLHAATADAIIAEANVLMCRGDFDAAIPLFESLLDVTTDLRTRGIALQNVGSMLAQRGQLGAAERAFGESYGCFQRAGYRRGEAIALNNHGRVALDRGDAELATRLLSHALEAARMVDDNDLIALATLNGAEALVAVGDSAAARELASTALGYFASAGNRWRQVECLRLLGGIHEREQDAASARRCFERGLGLAEEIGADLDRERLRDCLRRLPAE